MQPQSTPRPMNPYLEETITQPIARLAGRIAELEAEVARLRQALIDAGVNENGLAGEWVAWHPEQESGMHDDDTPRISIDVEPLHPGPDDPYAPLAAVSGEAMFPLYDFDDDDDVEPSDEYRGYIVGWQEWETLRALEQRFREIAAHIDELGLLMVGMSEELGNPVELFFGDRPHNDVSLFTEAFSEEQEARDGR